MMAAVRFVIQSADAFTPKPKRMSKLTYAAFQHKPLYKVTRDER
jgi:hypothetical protein